MSLFICDKCNAIENHCCLRPKNIEPKLNYPNMHLMDMQGHGDAVYIWDPDHNKSILFKEKNEVMMLCSECNTGYWHNEFAKEIVDQTSDKKYISRLSLNRYITPADHINGLTHRNGSLGEVELISEKTKTLIDWITMGYRNHYNESESNIVVMSKNDIRVNWLLQVYIENESSFEFSVIDRLFDEAIPGDGIYQFNLFIRDSLPEEVYEQSKMMKTIREFLEYSNNKPYNDVTDEYIDFERYMIIKNAIEEDNGLSFEAKMVSAINSLGVFSGLGAIANTEIDSLRSLADKIGFSKYKKIKQHWKNTQPKEEKDEKLRKAEEKRLRKLEKKKPNVK